MRRLSSALLASRAHGIVDEVLSMTNRKKNLEEVGKTLNSGGGVSHQALAQGVAAAGDEQALRAFLTGLNVALYRIPATEKTARVTGVRDTLQELLAVNPQLTAKVLRDLLEEMKLDYGDPLVEVVCAAASDAPPLLALLGEVVQRENQLLQLRVRALEALFMRSRSHPSSRWVSSEAENVIRCFNQVVRGLERGSLQDANFYQGLSDHFRTLNHLLVKGDLASLKSLPCGSYQGILRSVEQALQTLALAPISAKSFRVVLDLLKANTPLPSWHPASRMRFGGPSVSVWRWEEADWEATLALIIDKAVGIVFHIASRDWAGDVRSRGHAEEQAVKLLNPSNPAMLKSVVIDPRYPLKVRRMAAALLGVLGCLSPSGRLSAQAEFFTALFLMPHRSDALLDVCETAEGTSIVDAETKIPILIEALDEKSDYVRWNASRACFRAARDHPGWFQPKHYTKLLALLADDHRGVRLSIVQAFNALASSKEQHIARVIQGITSDLTERLYSTEDMEGLRRDLEMALGATLGNLVMRVDELQSEVRGLEERRRQLLGYIEQQTMRIGEEIHHEILNSLGGYLATAIDEERFGEAKRWLEELVVELRRIMNNLYPRDLETEGFLSTMRKRLEDARAQARKRTPEFRVEFRCPAEIKDQDILERLTDPSQLVLLYRIVLEAITNARKHARGTFVAIEVIRPEPRLVEISIGDDGCGNGGPFEQHVGIPLMLRRAQEIGAEIAFQKTSPAGGTMVVIRLGGKPAPESLAD